MNASHRWTGWSRAVVRKPHEGGLAASAVLRVVIQRLTHRHRQRRLGWRGQRKGRGRGLLRHHRFVHSHEVVFSCGERCHRDSSPDALDEGRSKGTARMEERGANEEGRRSGKKTARSRHCSVRNVMWGGCSALSCEALLDQSGRSGEGCGGRLRALSDSMLRGGCVASTTQRESFSLRSHPIGQNPSRGVRGRCRSRSSGW